MAKLRSWLHRAIVPACPRGAGLVESRAVPMRWYISAAAVREYQAIAGLPIDSGGPSFDRAERELAALADDARLTSDEGERQTWRVNATIDGRRSRLELTVVTTPRPEGPLPQLVRVRDKGARGRRQ